MGLNNNDNDNKVCNLECVKKGDVHEYIGQVKILLVDPPKKEYSRQLSRAAITTIASALIGANFFCIFLFCIGFKLPLFMNTHVILCTVGCQFCMPFGVLVTNCLFGPAVHLEPTERRLQHFLFQFMAFVLTGVGSAIAFKYGEISLFDPPIPYTSYHFYSGCVVGGCVVICFIIGPWLFCIKSEKVCTCFWTQVHRFFGILTIIASTVCFLLGIWKPVMQLWFYILGYNVAPNGALTFTCVLSAIFVIFTPCANSLCYLREKLKSV